MPLNKGKFVLLCLSAVALTLTLWSIFTTVKIYTDVESIALFYAKTQAVMGILVGILVSVFTFHMGVSGMVLYQEGSEMNGNE